VLIKLLRNGKVEEITVTIGRLPEDEDEQELAEGENLPFPPGEEEEDLLGLSIAPLTDDLRAQFGIDDTIEGVVITDVAPDSPAARKNVKPGDVIVEVTQEEVHQPQDVLTRLRAVKKSGRERVLLLLSDAKGELRFVAVPTS
jgi:serine protease Do